MLLIPTEAGIQTSSTNQQNSTSPRTTSTSNWLLSTLPKHRIHSAYSYANGTCIKICSFSVNWPARSRFVPSNFIAFIPKRRWLIQRSDDSATTGTSRRIRRCLVSMLVSVRGCTCGHNLCIMQYFCRESVAKIMNQQSTCRRCEERPTKQSLVYER